MCPNEAKVGLLESSGCLLSNPSGISKFGGHLPLQNCNLPRLLSVSQKSERKSFLLVFDFLEAQNLMKFLSNG